MPDDEARVKLPANSIKQNKLISIFIKELSTKGRSILANQCVLHTRMRSKYQNILEIAAAITETNAEKKN